MAKIGMPVEDYYNDYISLLKMSAGAQQNSSIQPMIDMVQKMTKCDRSEYT